MQSPAAERDGGAGVCKAAPTKAAPKHHPNPLFFFSLFYYFPHLHHLQVFKRNTTPKPSRVYFSLPDF